MATQKRTPTKKAVKKAGNRKAVKPASPSARKRPARKPVSPKKAKPAKRTPARRPAPVPFALQKPAPPVAPPRPLPRPMKFSAADLELFRRELMALRDRLTGQVARMRQDSLTRDDEVNPEEDGTDAFDRLFALERAGNDQNIIFTIDEAIGAIDAGKYGVCEGCGKLIEKPRLRALPFAKNCIHCQSEVERGRNNGLARRPMP